MLQAQHRSLLVSFHVSSWGARIKDKESEDRLSKWTNADPETFNVTKRLMPEAVKVLRRAIDRARADFRKMTLPWFDDGSRMLPVTKYLDFVQTMASHENAVEHELRNFLHSYRLRIAERQIKMSTAFNPDDYPSEEQIRQKFKFKVLVLPMPDIADFRINMAEDDIESIKTDLKAELEEAQAKATRELWGKLYKIVKHIHERMSDPDAIFKKNILENAFTLTVDLKGMDVTENAELEQCRIDVQNRLCLYDAETLRENPTARQSVADQAERILNKIKEFSNVGSQGTHEAYEEAA